MGGYVADETYAEITVEITYAALDVTETYAEIVVEMDLEPDEADL